MAEQEKFCLKWNDFERNISLAFKDLRDDRDFFDVTLACENSQIQAHKVILSACSPFFRGVLKQNPHQHPLLYLKDVRYRDLESVLNFMYHGEVNVAQDQLNSFLMVAEDLQVKGLTQNDSNNSSSNGSAKKQAAPPPKPVLHSRDKELISSSSGSGGGGGGTGGLKRSATIDAVSSRSETSRAPKLPKVAKIDYAEEEDDEVEEVTPPPVKVEAPPLVDVEQQNSQVEEYRYGDEPEEYGYDESGGGGGGYEDQEYEDSSLLQQEGMSTADLPPRPPRGWTGDGDARGGRGDSGVFDCEFCEKQFTNRKSLLNHLGLHRGLTSCLLCHKTFATKSSLNTHIRNTQCGLASQLEAAGVGKLASQ